MVIISEQRMRNTNALRGRYCSSDVEYDYSSVFPGEKKCLYRKQQREIRLERKAKSRPWGRFLRLRMCGL